MPDTVQRAFTRSDSRSLCDEMSKDQGFTRVVGSLHRSRFTLNNMQLLSVARSLLRLSWSLQYSTIPDFINTIQVQAEHDDFSLTEVTLFCQCLHNFHLMESIDDSLKDIMSQSALRILTYFHEMQMDDDQNLSGQLYQGMWYSQRHMDTVRDNC